MNNYAVKMDFNKNLSIITQKSEEIIAFFHKNAYICKTITY